MWKYDRDRLNMALGELNTNQRPTTTALTLHPPVRNNWRRDCNVVVFTGVRYMKDNLSIKAKFQALKVKENRVG